MRWHRWWHDYRDPGKLGVVAITHPWESGRDNSPDWDDALQAVDGSRVAPYERRDLKHVDAKMRPTKEEYDRYIALVEFGRSLGWNARDIGQRNPFFVADPGTTFILLAADRALMRMANTLKKIDDMPEIEEWIAAPRLGFNGYGTQSSRPLPPMICVLPPQPGRVQRGNALLLCRGWNKRAKQGDDRHYHRIRDKIGFGVASHDPDEPNFDSMRYWRGPVWAFMNMMIGKGFRDQGYMSEALELWDDTRTLVNTASFAEYFDCNLGVPAGGAAFSWTAAMWLQYATIGSPWAPAAVPSAA
jgi:hypothetical protein